ncbi:MAG: hypothetical protein II820_04010 [Ruminiclostridium sp.]|nr:hypothetical protein [Ruminiclostridium sp.]
MSENIKNIKWFSIITAFFLVLTYIFSIVEFKYDFISSNFLFTAFGGVFASFCVVLIMEIIKYRITKKTVEDSIYQNLVMLYKYFVYELQNSKVYKDNKMESVPENLYTAKEQLFVSICNYIRFLDYCSICKSVLFKEISRFKNEEIPCLDMHINKAGYLRIAILQTKINNNTPNCQPTYSDIMVSNVINKMMSDAEIRSKAIDGLLNIFESSFPKRYNWKNDKKIANAISVTLESLNTTTADFLIND